MADKNIDPLVTPEINGLDSWNKGITSAGNSSSLNNGHSAHAHHRRASIGSYQMADSSRRNSIEKQECLNRSQSLVPHYLRASTGSCHDLCKYGRRHAFEEKARTPLRSRLAKTSPIELNSVETLNSGEQTKEKAGRYKPFKNTTKHAPDLKSSPGIKFYSPKPKASLNTKTSYTRQNTSSADKIHLPKHEPSLSKKTFSPDSPEIIKQEIVLSSEKVVSPLKKGYLTDSEMLWTENKNRTHYLSNKTSFGPLKPVMVKPSSSSGASDGAHGERRRNSDITAGRKLTALKASSQKAMSAPATSLSSKLSLSKAISTKARKARSLKLSSPFKDQNSTRRTEAKTSNNEKVSEKILHVIKTGTKNRALKSRPDCRAVPSVPSPSFPKSLSNAKSANLLSHVKDAEGETEYSGSKAEVFVPENVGKVGRAEPVTRDLSKTLRKSRVVVTEDKHRSTVKLKFRSGKVVDLTSDNNSPRRLRFRRARGPGAAERKGDSRTRVFKKAEGNDDMNGSQLSSEKVVLKHQDVQAKKDAQGLFNNVIEETANKLVESRKSKVQALVGAFETVISLQDSKPSSLTVS